MSDTAEPPPPSQGPWDPDHLRFPAGGSTQEKLRFLLNLAVLAPSERNSQPWLFRVRDDSLELYADRARQLAVVDPEDREMTISCGASLFYLRIALRHFGYEAQVEELPDPEDPDLLARLRVGDARKPSKGEEALFQAIAMRHTNRFPFKANKVPQQLIYELEDDARQEGAWLHIAAGPREQFPLAYLIAEADQQQWADNKFRDEMADWVHPSGHPAPDGIPGQALALEDADTDIGPLLMQAFDMSKRVASRDYKLAIAAPVLAVLGTDGDTAADWLHAGQAVARILLRAAFQGVSAGFFNQPIQVARTRSMVLEKIDRQGFPQLMFRLGFGYAIRPTPRRGPDDVAIN